MSSTLKIFALLLISIDLACSATSHPDVLDILPPGYNANLPPVTDDGKPVKVRVSVIFLNVRLSSDASQTFTGDIFFHNYWSDHRLRKPSENATERMKITQRSTAETNETLPEYKLNDAWRQKLWTPDTYFRNAISGQVSSILTPTSYFVVTNYTEIFMAVRIQLTLTCSMDFEHFPFDKQTCFINLTSTSEEVDTMELVWDTFRIGNHVDKTEFEIIAIGQSSCTKDYDIGILSCLYGTIEFKRNIGNYLIKRFIPSSVIVVLTFIGFWIPTTNTAARISLSTTSLLALITQQIQSDLDVSYVYALQVWNIYCIAFVFASLLEYAIALYVMHMAEKRKKKHQQQARKNIEEGNNNNNSKSLGLNKDPKQPFERSQSSKASRYWARWEALLSKHFRTTSRHSSVDNLARYVFPIGFIIFVLCFLSYVKKI